MIGCHCVLFNFKHLNILNMFTEQVGMFIVVALILVAVKECSSSLGFVSWFFFHCLLSSQTLLFPQQTPKTLQSKEFLFG
jgi:hypothetical protein